MTDAEHGDEAVSDDRVTHFVRRTLGCSCPDEVFERIHTVAGPEAFNGLPVDYRIEIGGRLLVAVCVTAPWREVLRALEAVVAAGRRYRDRNGFNRFRLVVAAQRAHEAQAVLQPVFDAAGDEKTHLHVLTPAALPWRRPLLQ